MAVRMIAGDPKEAQKFFANKLGFTTGPMELDYMIKKGEPPTIIDVRAAVDSRYFLCRKRVFFGTTAING